MRAEIFMERVENRELERINDAADCVDDTACKQPSECRVRKRVPKRSEYQEANPAHCDVDCGRKPFRTGNPTHIDTHSGKGDTPYEGEQGVSHASAEYDKAHGGVRSGNQYKNHHMVYFTENIKNLSCNVYAVIERACAVQ